MASALYTEVKSNGAGSTFVRPQEGLFGLREWKTDAELCSLVAAESAVPAVAAPVRDARRAPRRHFPCAPEDSRWHTKRRKAGGALFPASDDADAFDGLRLLVEAVEIDCAESNGESSEKVGGSSHEVQRVDANGRGGCASCITRSKSDGAHTVPAFLRTDRRLEFSAEGGDKYACNHFVPANAEDASCRGRLLDGDCQSSLLISSTDQTSSERTAIPSPGRAQETPSSSSAMPLKAIINSITAMEKSLGQDHPLVGQGYLFLSRVLQLQGTLPAVLMAQGALNRVYQILGSLIGTANLQRMASWQDFHYLFGRLSQRLEHQRHVEQHRCAQEPDLPVVKQEADIAQGVQEPPQHVKINFEPK
eukprot:evm.model.scf_1208EXC.3 EVM.evm.TU.scf_1208EXC.3   scf_1208EXC:19313-21733(+)